MKVKYPVWIEVSVEQKLVDSFIDNPEELRLSMVRQIELLAQKLEGGVREFNKTLLIWE